MLYTASKFLRVKDSTMLRPVSTQKKSLVSVITVLWKMGDKISFSWNLEIIYEMNFSSVYRRIVWFDQWKVKHVNVYLSHCSSALRLCLMSKNIVTRAYSLWPSYIFFFFFATAWKIFSASPFGPNFPGDDRMSITMVKKLKSWFRYFRSSIIRDH